MNIQPINIMAMTSELLSRTSIIKLPEGTKYKIQDTLNVILHAATSVTNSLESASIDLRLKNPDKNIPSADSIHDYINSNSIDYIMSAFRHITAFRYINTEIIELAHPCGTAQELPLISTIYLIMVKRTHAE